ncbi:MAG: DegQ family serine endoprotease [Chromatiales bacterium]|nr:DegQ family serine endoprotease [Gammaproteobacteria bacterium]MBW6476820.1 DegQ family serine endoprotease [Chromatiales bacterium]
MIKMILARHFLLIVMLGLLALPLQARELPEFTRLVEAHGPAVVNISTTQKRSTRSSPHEFSLPEMPRGGPWDDLLRHFFGERGEGEEMPREREARSLGSGFIIDRAGYIITNNHVIDDAETITVRLSDRREVNAELIGADKQSDIALLKIEAADLPFVKLGRSEKLRVGEWVMAIGSPFGFDHSVSVGVVSALGRSLPSENYVPFIQTDVAINPGNSGGPLFNLDGEVVGVNSQIYSRTGGFMGLSFAIPIDVAMDVVTQLKEQGHVTRGWLGVLIQDVTRDLAESFGLQRPMGALVAQVMDGSPAAKAGVQAGDVILAFNGQEVNTSAELPPLVGRARVGQDAQLRVLRDGKTRNLKVRIAELPSDATEPQASPSRPSQPETDRLGLAVKPLNDAQRKELGIDKGGVLIERIEDGPAASAGLSRGDVITRLNNRPVESERDYQRILEALPAGRSVPVLIIRGGSPRFFALRIPAE